MGHLQVALDFCDPQGGAQERPQHQGWRMLTLHTRGLVMAPPGAAGHPLLPAPRTHPENERPVGTCRLLTHHPPPAQRESGVQGERRALEASHSYPLVSPPQCE